jgi:hypothetical protein
MNRLLLILSAITVLGLPIAANAQTLSNDMTCDEAKKYYAEHRQINVRDGDQVLPIYGGVPGDDPLKLECEPGNEPGPLSVPTKDEARCQVGYECQG